MIYARFVKRGLDIAISFLALIFCSPLLLVIAGLVRVFLGSPVLFRQQRPGLHGRPFTMMKFRTMLEAADSYGRPYPDAQRLTPFGQMLRSTSLDELPEPINVLRGDMSLVGPRPLLMHYLPLYTPEQLRRHAVRPGITGWAQINGSNALSWEQKFACDIWYIEHLSLRLDITILVQTLWKALQREGISQAGQVTMEEFKGTKTG